MSSVAPPIHQREANPTDRPTFDPKKHPRRQLQRLVMTIPDAVRPCRSVTAPYPRRLSHGWRRRGNQRCFSPRVRCLTVLAIRVTLAADVVSSRSGPRGLFRLTALWLNRSGKEPYESAGLQYPESAQSWVHFRRNRCPLLLTHQPPTFKPALGTRSIVNSPGGLLLPALRAEDRSPSPTTRFRSPNGSSGPA
jgi:hypothetical protein